MLRQALLAKLLEQIDPFMKCDMCPSFKLIVHNGCLDIELYTEDESTQWVLFDEDAQDRLIDVVDSLKLFEHTKGGLERFKIKVAQLLVREVQSGNLFKAPGYYKEKGNEEIQ